jgi:phosphate:Na+ symporter
MARKPVIESPIGLEEEIIAMCDSTREMLEATWDGFRRQDRQSLYKAEKIGQEIHQKEKELTNSIIIKFSRSQEHIKDMESLGFLPAHLERIGDDIELLIRCIRTMALEGTLFSERAIKETNTLFGKAIELVECVRDAIKTKNKVLIRYVIEEGEKFQDRISDYSLAHQERLIEGVCMSKSSSVYLAILDHLAEIERHIRQMANKVFS